MDPSALEFVLRWEGGEKITDDPNDPGGITRWGISKRAYPSLDIATLTREQAVEIYERDYWQATGCGLLPAQLALCVFNAAVNIGPSKARKWLNACGGDYREFLRMQITHYVGLRNRLYIIGWMNRTLDAWANANRLQA